MNLLLDTHALLWWLDRPDRLSQRATRAIQDHKNQVIVSSVIAWELAIKVNAGRLDVKDLISEFETVMTEKGFLALAISTEHALRAGVLTLHHRDPFDRMLVAQAQTENWPIVSCDRVFDLYSVRRVW